MIYRQLTFIALVIFILAGCNNNKEPRRVREINDSLAVAENRPRPPKPKTAEDSVVANKSEFAKDSLLFSNLSKSKDLTFFTNSLKSTKADTIINKEKSVYTIFAPLNSAFDLIPPLTLDDLKKPESKNRFRTILTYHIIPGNFKADSLKTGINLKTIQGEQLSVRVQDTTIFILDSQGAEAAIKTRDIASKNGTIHTIKSVLMPKK